MGLCLNTSATGVKCNLILDDLMYVLEAKDKPKYKQLNRDKKKRFVSHHSSAFTFSNKTDWVDFLMLMYMNIYIYMYIHIEIDIGTY